MDLNIFETNETKSDDGVWVPVDLKTSVKIARYGNRKFNRALQRGMKPYKQLIDKEALDDETSDKVFVTAIVEGILVDWRGMVYNGEPLPYSKEAAIKILMNKKLRDFREFVIVTSQDMQLYRDEEVAEAEGKSESSSDGSLSGESEKISSAA